MRTIYHITTLLEWEKAKKEEEYFSSDFERIGFIHCCTQEQISGVLQRYFSGRSGLVIFHISEQKLSDLRYEKSTGDELFPHLYGPIPVKEIVKVEVVT